MTGYQIHARNAAAMWEALAEQCGSPASGTDAVRIVEPSPYHALRAVVVDAAANRSETIRRIVDDVLPRTDRVRRIVEDPSGALDLSGVGFVPRFRMAVMGRTSSTEPIHGRSTVASSGRPRDRSLAGDISVKQVSEPEELTEAEQIMTAVFPPDRREPGAGQGQSARVLDIPGWQVWLGRRDGVPAGTAHTYDDGTSVGVYQVATLSEHRGHGVARAIMESVLNAHPDATVTLTATEQGRPLYTAYGFEVLSDAIWWVPVPTGDDSQACLR
jgi:GNAT superfamily N-acetyltransferase